MAAATEAPAARNHRQELPLLGYRALRDLLGSIGKSSLGRHDTREMATGIEASGAPKVYEFGDTMNLDASGTILNAVMRQKAIGRGAIEVDYEDLMVVQGEYQSSCATVVMLDCSHSMISTARIGSAAKRVAWRSRSDPVERRATLCCRSFYDSR